MTSAERSIAQLRRALQVTVGALDLIVRHQNISERTIIKVNLPMMEPERYSLAQVLDMADAALETQEGQAALKGT